MRSRLISALLRQFVVIFFYVLTKSSSLVFVLDVIVIDVLAVLVGLVVVDVPFTCLVLGIIPSQLWSSLARFSESPEYSERIRSIVTIGLGSIHFFFMLGHRGGYSLLPLRYVWGSCSWLFCCFHCRPRVLYNFCHRTN